MEFVVLGSSASVPTRARGLTAGLLRVRSERVLIDCGEGTGRQLLLSGQRLQAPSFVWLSHSHIDHCLGVAGLLWSYDVLASTRTIQVLGNASAIDRVRALAEQCDLRSLRLETRVIGEGRFHVSEGFEWHSFELEHTVPTLGLAVIEKPRRQFDAKAAERLGVPEGPLRRRLVVGESVVLPNGTEVRAEDVLETRPESLVI